MASLLAWFSTEMGQKIVGYGMFTIGITSFTSYVMIHTFGIDKYQEILQMYQYTHPVPIDENTLALTNQVMNDIKLDNYEQKLVQCFTVVASEPVHIGSILTRQGIRIGLPKTFAYKTISDIPKEDILIKNEEVSWESKDGANLLKSLILSDDARKFVIAREIFHGKTTYVYMNGLYSASCIYLAYCLSVYLNEKLQGFRRPLAFRSMLYVVIGTFSYGIWSMLMYGSRAFNDRRADKAACNIGTHYAKGGVEYYSKLLQRNVAIRGLSGKDGEKMYTAAGNHKIFLRQKYLPISYRKNLTETILQELEMPKTVKKTEVV